MVGRSDIRSRLLPGRAVEARVQLDFPRPHRGRAPRTRPTARCRSSGRRRRRGASRCAIRRRRRVTAHDEPMPSANPTMSQNRRLNTQDAFGLAASCVAAIVVALDAAPAPTAARGAAGVSPSRNRCAARDTPVPNAIAFTTGERSVRAARRDAPSTAPLEPLGRRHEPLDPVDLDRGVVHRVARGLEQRERFVVERVRGVAQVAQRARRARRASRRAPRPASSRRSRRPPRARHLPTSSPASSSLRSSVRGSRRRASSAANIPGSAPCALGR